MKAIFFSDAHLRRDETAKISLVERFIREVCSDADVVCILGDLFEFYAGYRYTPYPYPWYRDIVEALRRILAEGGKVLFTEGNHEFRSTEVEAATGIRCSDSFVLDLDGIRTYIAHGDTFGGARFTRFIKSGPVLGLMRLLGPLTTWKIAMAVSTLLSRKQKGRYPQAKTRFREYAIALFSQGFDAVILAHTHLADEVEKTVNGKTKRYFNTGDFSRDLTYVEYDSGKGFRLRTFTPARP